MVKSVYIGVSGQGDACVGPSPLLKINKSPNEYRGYFLIQNTSLDETRSQ